MLIRWIIGIAVVFALLALVARLLQFAASLVLIIVAGLALAAAAVLWLLSSFRGRRDGGA